MKKLLVAFIILSVALFSQEYEKQKVRIKFSSNSDLLIKIQNNEKVNEISEIIGDYKISQFIPDNLIKAYKKAYRAKHNQAFMASELPFEYVYDFEYSSNIDAQIAANKLEKNQSIIYAEPIYKREFFSVPNDAQVSEQYHHSIIKTFEAWDLLNTSREVVVGIVDTGIELNHEDLAANIWNNKGEMGIDKNGDPKESNGVDDDDNGYVDDWRGWDVAMSDNDPNPGHTHGTHVAGIVNAVSNNGLGVSGVAKNFKLAAVKVGYDSRNNTGVINGYEGILYAATIGCDVINCSWGGGGSSNAENGVIESALNLGSVIVCAAGNNGALQAFYPAAYEGVISVASTTDKDRQSGFSNYHPSVDVSAPGSNILSTVVDGKYDLMSGTSMASPVAAGVAALIVANFPDYSPQQVAEHLMATSDNIDSNLASSRKNNFGKGRVNAYKALSNKTAKLVRMVSYSVTDLDGNNILEPGDELEINVEYSNKLSVVNGLQYNVINSNDNSVVLTGNIGDMKVNDTKSIKFNYTLPEELDFDYIYQIPIDLTNNSDYTSRDIVSFTVNQSYRTLSENLISFTANSKGNIGYNDYPANEQGIGIRYKDGESLTYEGSIMVGAGQSLVASSARSESQNRQDNDFYIQDIVKEEVFGETRKLSSKFSDIGFMEVLGIEVAESVYYINDGLLKNAIILEHTICNKKEIDYDSLCVAYYFDWDIGASSHNNIAMWDDKTKIISQNSLSDLSQPYCGLAVLSDQNAIGFALDNDGEEETNPGVYDGFTKQEKWDIMSGKIKRTTSNVTDASSIISAGPMKLKANDSVKVDFVIMISNDKDQLVDIYNEAKSKLNELKTLSVETAQSNFKLFPNPINSAFINYEFDNQTQGLTKIKIIDLKGNILKEKSQMLNIGKVYGNESVEGLANGTYILTIESQNKTKTQMFIIKK